MMTEPSVVRRNVYNALWLHFERDHYNRMAKCNYCQKLLSYRSTITNLKSHLKAKHPLGYDEYLQQKDSEKVDVEKAMVSYNLSMEPAQEKDDKQQERDASPERANERKKEKQERNALWNYFEDIPLTKHAECNFCKKSLSYKTSVGNLKSHLKLKHRSAYKEYAAAIGITKDPFSRKPRLSNNPIWKFFEKDPSSAIKAAECNFCHKSLVYRTSISNLKQHLKGLHRDAYKKLQKLLSSMIFRHDKESDDSDDYSDYYESSDQSEEDAVDKSLNLPDVWNYFEEESDGRAVCVVCRSNVGHDYEELKAHLKENHPKLLLQIMQNKESQSDTASNPADDDNTYTEVVYLEQDALTDTPSTTQDIPKPTPKKTWKQPMKRERTDNSYEEIPQKRQRETKITEDDDELMSFIKYITCLLRKLDPDTFAKVQIDIINTILKANKTTNSQTTGSRQIILNNELPQNNVPNLITVNEITPINSALLGHNYTITVANKDVEKSNETS